MRKINVTAVSSAIMLSIAVIIWIAIPYCIDEVQSPVDIGPRAFPQFVCAVMAVLSVVQLLLLITGAQKGKYKEVNFKDRSLVYIAMVLALLTVIASAFINIILSGVVCAMIFLVLMKIKDWKYYGAVAVTGIILLVLMKSVMNIRF